MQRRKKLFWISLLVIALLAFAGTAYAQDGDGDGVPDTADRCPNQPGPRTNGGCPLATPTPAAGVPVADRDGDGVADFVDACPDQAGTGFTGGCPEGVQPVRIEPTQAVPQVIMVWDITDECRVGVPLNSPGSVNVRDVPSMSGVILGQLAPGAQFEPWFRDYDENNQVWFGGAPTANGYGWVNGSVVINNGMCVNLPMVVHVDAPQAPPVEVKFDPNLIPEELRPDGDSFDLRDLLVTHDVILVDWGDLGLTPDVTITPTVQPTQTAGAGGGAHVRVFDGRGVSINWLDPEDGSFIPTDQKMMVFGHENGGQNCILIGETFCIDLIVLLPDPDADPGVGDPTGQCTFDQMMEGLELAGYDDPSPIALLLPAVQKVREAAARMGDGSVRPGGISVAGGDLNGDGFDTAWLLELLADPPDPDMPSACGVVMIGYDPAFNGGVNIAAADDTQGILIGLLLPAIQK